MRRQHHHHQQHRLSAPHYSTATSSLSSPTSSYLASSWFPERAYDGKVVPSCSSSDLLANAFGGGGGISSKRGRGEAFLTRSRSLPEQYPGSYYHTHRHQHHPSSALEDDDDDRLQGILGRWWLRRRPSGPLTRPEDFFGEDDLARRRLADAATSRIEGLTTLRPEEYLWSRQQSLGNSSEEDHRRRRLLLLQQQLRDRPAGDQSLHRYHQQHQDHYQSSETAPGRRGWAAARAASSSPLTLGKSLQLVTENFVGSTASKSRSGAADAAGPGSAAWAAREKTVRFDPKDWSDLPAGSSRKGHYLHHHHQDDGLSLLVLGGGSFAQDEAWLSGCDDEAWMTIEDVRSGRWARWDEVRQESRDSGIETGSSCFTSSEDSGRASGWLAGATSTRDHSCFVAKKVYLS